MKRDATSPTQAPRRHVARDRKLTAFMNRMITLEHASLGAIQEVLRVEDYEPTRERLREMMDDDEHAVTALERAIRELDGHVSELRKVGGRLAGRARSVIDNLPDRARAVIEKRDLSAARESPALAQLNAYAEAYAAEAVADTHWRLLAAVASETHIDAIEDATTACRDVSASHVRYFEERAAEVAKEAFHVAMPEPRV